MATSSFVMTEEPRCQAALDGLPFPKARPGVARRIYLLTPSPRVHSATGCARRPADHGESFADRSLLRCASRGARRDLRRVARSRDQPEEERSRSPL
jgi:hypothetical protein